MSAAVPHPIDEIMQLLRMSTPKSTPRYCLDYRPQKNMKASSCLSRTGEVSAAALCTPIRCPNLASPGQSHTHFHPSLLVKHFGAPPFWPDRSVLLFYHSIIIHHSVQGSSTPVQRHSSIRVATRSCEYSSSLDVRLWKWKQPRTALLCGYSSTATDWLTVRNRALYLLIH